MEAKYTYGDVQVSKRRNLPHWQTPRGIYLVTFRLHDAVPLARLTELRKQRAKQLDAAPDDIERRRDAERRYRTAIESILDEGIGGCVLARADAGALVERALHYFDSDRYDLATWSVMPNHVHAIFQLLDQHTLVEVLRSWKRYTSREINAIVGRTGALWQEEYFDTLIRSPRHLLTAVDYVFNNPLKAGISPRFTGRCDEVISMLQGPQGEWAAAPKV